MECITGRHQRSLLQAAVGSLSTDDVIVLDGAGGAVAPPPPLAPPPGASQWHQTQEVALLLTLIGAYLLFFGQVILDGYHACALFELQ